MVMVGTSLSRCDLKRNNRLLITIFFISQFYSHKPLKREGEARLKEYR